MNKSTAHVCGRESWIMFVLLLQTLIDEQETGPGAEALSRAYVKETSIN